MPRRNRVNSTNLAIALITAAGPGSAQAEWMPSRTISARFQHAMAYDAARQRVVCFGGGNITADGMTWEWDGAAWTSRSGGTLPPGRALHAMAYDAARRVVVLFGGSTPFADTWEWDGSQWTQRQPVTSPGVRQGHAMVYDAARQRVVLFGGESSAGFLADTWEWDGTVWVQMATAGSPPGREAHAMAYDAVRGRTVLFGGYNGSGNGTTFADTWTWDGVGWSQIAAPSSPGPRMSSLMAYDSVRQVVVLHGGEAPQGSQNDTWEWNGSTWTVRVPAQSPPLRYRAAMATDTARGRVVLFGGSDGGISLEDTWEWDGTNWALRHGQAGRLRRGTSGFAVAYDMVRERLCQFGGFSYGLVDETWEWDGTVWTRRQPAVSPSPRYGQTMAYDLARQRVVLFGGRAGPNTFNDTWTWDGTTWSQMSPASVPPQRYQSAMTYDIGRQRVVMYGGVDQNLPSYADTWEWDGFGWIDMSPTIHPGVRAGHAMAYDLARQQVVMFGGGGLGIANAWLADTWEWDGSTWAQQLPASNPPGRANHSMAFDQRRQRTVLYGGNNQTTGFYVPWEWDGAAWTPLPSPRAPRVASSAVAYDSRLQLVVGDDRGQTWLHGDLMPAVAQQFGQGCPGSHGEPILTCNEPYLGNPSFRWQVQSVPPRAPCLLALGWSSLSGSPAGACTLLVLPTVILSVTANSAGLAETGSLTVPNRPLLRGLVLYAQAAAVDPQGLAGGLSATAGRRLVVGD